MKLHSSPRGTKGLKINRSLGYCVPAPYPPDTPGQALHSIKDVPFASAQDVIRYWILDIWQLDGGRRRGKEWVVLRKLDYYNDRARERFTELCIIILWSRRCGGSNEDQKSSIPCHTLGSYTIPFYGFNLAC